MPTDASPAPRPVMPPSVRVAVGVQAVLALLLLSNGLLLWAGFDVAVDRVLEETDDITRDEAAQFVLLSLVPYLALGVVLAVAAVFLVRRRGWARWTGVVATGALVLLTVVSVLATGGVTVASLLLLVLSIAGVTSLLAATDARLAARGAAPPPDQRGWPVARAQPMYRYQSLVGLSASSTMPASSASSWKTLSAERKPVPPVSPPSVPNPARTARPPSTHSTMRAQLRPRQAHQMNRACSTTSTRPMTAPTRIAVRRTSSVMSGSVVVRDASRTRSSMSEKATSEPTMPSTKLTTNAPMPARTVSGCSAEPGGGGGA